MQLREKAYLACVRPILKDASFLWDLYTKNHIEKIESMIIAI